MKKLITFLLLFISIASFADDLDLSKYFQGKTGCFILYDLNQDKTVLKFNPARCAQRIQPDSTFKIALSLMAFDQNLIEPNTVFKWDGKDKGFPAWNQDQTPKSWFENSAVWVSRELTPQLGLQKISYYLKQFNYGNQEFDSLTQAWLTGSLKISANEQLLFLKALAMGKLPVSNKAMLVTKANMYLETLANGWQLFGKTGSGFYQTSKKYRQGWFVGYIEKGDKTKIFVLNFSDLQPAVDLADTQTKELPGPQAKKMLLAILELIKPSPLVGEAGRRPDEQLC